MRMRPIHPFDTSAPSNPMKKHLITIVSSVLLATAILPCLGMMAFASPAATPAKMIEIVIVTPSIAKDMGMELRAKASGPEVVRVELEFKTKDKLKEFVRVDLEICDGDLEKGGKWLLSTALKEDRPKPDQIGVSFATTRANLKQLTLRIIAGPPGNYTGYDLSVTKFVDVEKLK